MQMILKFAAALMPFVFLVLFAAVLFSVPTWLLWNWLMPDIFGLPTITIFQAVGLSFLSSILFKINVSNSKN